MAPCSCISPDNRFSDTARTKALASLLAALSLAIPGSAARAEGPVLPHPILFVTQVPVPSDFTTVGSTFGNHVPTMQAAARGGDLWIRYEDGTLRNLTAAAGYGTLRQS